MAGPQIGMLARQWVGAAPDAGRSQDEGRDRSAGVAGSTGRQIEFQTAARLPCRRLVTTSLPTNVSMRAVEDLATGASRRVPERLLGRPAQSRRVAQAVVPGQVDAHQGVSVDASRPEGTRRLERQRRVTGGRGSAALPGSSMAKGSVWGRRRGQRYSPTPSHCRVTSARAGARSLGAYCRHHLVRV